MEDLSPIEQELAALYQQGLAEHGRDEPGLDEIGANTRRLVGVIDVLAFTIGRLWHGCLVMLGADAAGTRHEGKADVWRSDE